MIKPGKILSISIAFLTIMIAMNISAEEAVVSGRVLTTSDYEPVIVEKTESKSKQEQSVFFETHLVKLTKLDQDKILFRTDGRIGMNTENGWTTDFIIGENDKFRMPPDDHGSTVYQLESLGDESITVHYKSDFNHSSFGDNRQTIDEGTFEVEYRQ
jgi:hypothetical protein